MKRIHVISLATLAVIAYAVVPTNAQTDSPRIAVVSQDRVLNESEEGKLLRIELEKLRDIKGTELEAKEKELQSLQDQLLNAQLSLSNEKRQELSRAVKRKRVEYERMNDDAMAEFQEAANQAQAKLIKMFREMIKGYGAEKGFTLILEASTLYYSADAVDVTDDLLARFNAKTTAGASN